MPLQSKICSCCKWLISRGWLRRVGWAWDSQWRVKESCVRELGRGAKDALAGTAMRVSDVSCSIFAAASMLGCWILDSYKVRFSCWRLQHLARADDKASKH